MLTPGDALALVRQKRPVLHHIMNQVTMSFVANGVLALGGRPMMARHPDEAAEAASKADGLVLNLGTPTPETIEAMLLAGKAARVKGIPIVFDPVGVGLSAMRGDAATRILEELHPTAICGNAAELSYLLTREWHGKGIDAAAPVSDPVEIAVQVARRYRCLAVLTGKTDVICGGRLIATSGHGDEWLTLVTGTGCLATSIVALFLAAIHSAEAGSKPHASWEASIAAVCTLGIAAEEARLAAAGPGKFQQELLDQLYTLQPALINTRAEIRLHSR
ncbi:UNVERIFIED_CONTAM: hydroxyethylthiazole kinase [Brevibacillus sp. OAP136]